MKPIITKLTDLLQEFVILSGLFVYFISLGIRSRLTGDEDERF